MKPRHIKANARGHQRPSKVSFGGYGQVQTGPFSQGQANPSAKWHKSGWTLVTWDRERHIMFLWGLGQAIVPLQCAGPRRLLQVAQLSKKIVVNKCVLHSPSGDNPFQKKPTTSTFKRRKPHKNPSQNPSLHHAHTQTHRDQHIYPKQSHKGSHFRSCRSHGGGGSSTCRSTAFAAGWIHHLHLPLPISLKVKFQSDRNTEILPACRLHHLEMAVLADLPPCNCTIWHLKLCFHFWGIMHMPQLPSQMCHPTALPFFFKLRFGILLSEHDCP